MVHECIGTPALPVGDLCEYQAINKFVDHHKMDLRSIPIARHIIFCMLLQKITFLKQQN